MAGTQNDCYYRKQGEDWYFEFGAFTWEKLFILYMKGRLKKTRK